MVLLKEKLPSYSWLAMPMYLLIHLVFLGL